MATNVVIGSGAAILIDDGTGSNWVPISEVRNFGDYISIRRTRIDVSHFATPLTGRDLVGGAIELKDFPFQVNYIPGDGTHDHLTGLIKAAKDDDDVNLRVRLPGADNVGVTITGKVNCTGDQLDRTTPLTMSVTIEPTLWDMIVYTPGVSGW